MFIVYFPFADLQACRRRQLQTKVAGQRLGLEVDVGDVRAINLNVALPNSCFGFDS